MSEPRDLAATILETAEALVVVLDSEGRITYFNRACEELTGYSRDEVVGRVLWDFLLPERYIAGTRNDSAVEVTRRPHEANRGRAQGGC